MNQSGLSQYSEEDRQKAREGVRKREEFALRRQPRFLVLADALNVEPRSKTELTNWLASGAVEIDVSLQRLPFVLKDASNLTVCSYKGAPSAIYFTFDQLLRELGTSYVTPFAEALSYIWSYGNQTFMVGTAHLFFVEDTSGVVRILHASLRRGKIHLTSRESAKEMPHTVRVYKPNSV